jgi:hypothetical protein
MAKTSKSTAVEPMLPEGSSVHTVTVKVVIGHAKGSRRPAVAPERVAEAIARCLNQLRDDHFKLSPDELGWEFPFWARSLNG